MEAKRLQRDPRTMVVGIWLEISSETTVRKKTEFAPIIRLIMLENKKDSVLGP